MDKMEPELMKSGNSSLCISESKMKTPFNQALHGHFVVYFVQAGFSVGECDGSGASVKITTQLVNHPGDRSRWPTGHNGITHRVRWAGDRALGTSGAQPIQDVSPTGERA